MSKVIGRVIEKNGSVEGSEVELSNGSVTLIGRVASVSDNEFVVDWSDGVQSTENKSDYELVIESKTAFKGKCQVKGCSQEQAGYGVCERHQATPIIVDELQAEVARRKKEEAGQSVASVKTAQPTDISGRRCQTGECSNLATDVVRFKDGPGETFHCREHAIAATRGRGLDPTKLEMPNHSRPSKGKSLEGHRVAQENPAQPAGWAVPPVDENAYPNGELLEVEMEKRQDTAAWEDSQNRAPVDAENPAQPAGYAVPPASGQPIPGQGADALAVKANVYAENVAGENGRVELENGTLHFAGRVVAADDEIFIVEWDDDSRTIENKSDYDLIITSSAPDPEAERFDTISLLFSKPTEDGKFSCSYCNNFTGSSDSEVVNHFYAEHEHDGEFEWGMLPGADDV